MAEINKLTAVDSVAASDQVPIYSASNGDARKVSMTNLRTFMTSGIASDTHSATNKITPVDADEFPIVDSASSFALKKLNFGNLKTWVKSIFSPAGGAALIGNSPSGTISSNNVQAAINEIVSDNASTAGAGLIGTIVAAWTTVQGFITYLATSAGSSVIGFIQAGTGAVATTSQTKIRETVSVKDFGAVGDGVADDYAAIILARDYARSIFAQLLFPAGTYKHGTTLAFGATREMVVFDPGVILHYSGGATTAGVTLDGGAVSSSYAGSFGWGCPPRIQANAASYGVYVRAWHHGKADFEVTAAVTAAYKIDWAVCSEFRVAASVNRAAFIVAPTNGLIVDKRGAGEYTADCIFHNNIFEGLSGIGINITDGTGNKFIGGTSEASGIGINIASASNDNVFENVWCEGNSTGDLELYGSHNIFDNCHFASASTNNSVEIVTGEQNVFNGGYIRVANMAAGSSRSVFNYVETSDNVSLGLIGAGSFSNIACYESNISGVITAKVPDLVGEPSGTWTPAFSSSGGGAQGAVTSNTGTYCRVGKMCFIQAFVAIAKGTLGAGTISLTGFPFAVRNSTESYQYFSVMEWESINLGAGYTNLVLRIAPGGTTGLFLKSGSSVASATVALADFPATMTLKFSGICEIG